MHSCIVLGLRDVAERVLVAPDDQRRSARQSPQPIGPQQIALADLHVLQAQQVVDAAAEFRRVVDAVTHGDQLVGDVPVDVVHQQLEPLPRHGRIVELDGPQRRRADPLHDLRVGAGPAGGDQLQGVHPLGMLAGEPGRDPPAERFPCKVHTVDALRVEVTEHVLDVARDLVVEVGLVRVAVTEQIDGVAAEPGVDVGDDVAGERLQVTARPVKEQDVRTVTGDERPRTDPADIDSLEAERDSEIGPDGHAGSWGAAITATAIPVFHSGTGE